VAGQASGMEMDEMRIGLIDVDGNKYPNLALMKISAWHKKQGDKIMWFEPLFNKPDKCYASKVFTFTKDFEYWPECEIIKGGTGYDIKTTLPSEIEAMLPDYSIYPLFNYALGFLTRGCPRKCSWCIVPAKEGGIQPANDIEQIAVRKNILLMDNNVLACDHGIKQIEKIGNMNIKIDFNQGLDARLIDNVTAKLLAKCKWLSPLRLACDQESQMPSVEKAIKFLRKNNCTPKRYFCYVLVKDIADALKRVEFLKKLNIDCFAQPYRDFDKNISPTAEQQNFSRWVNHKAIFKSVSWKDYTIIRRHWR
jgi:hypothetical protein